MREVKAISESRYRRRGQTVTSFFVWFVDDPTSQRKVEGLGAHPSTRKADAIAKFREASDLEREPRDPCPLPRSPCKCGSCMGLD